MRDISNSADILDSRDIVERIEELEGEREAYAEQVEADEEALADFIESGGDETSKEAAALSEAIEEARKALADWDESGDAEELKIFKAFADQLEGYGDWDHGETLIRHDYFTEYCQEMLADIGDLPRDLPGYIAIDWDATAENLKIDYTEGTFDGVTYYMRA